MRNLIITLIAALSFAAFPAHADRGYRHGGEHRHRGGNGSAWAGVAILGAVTGLAIMADRSRPLYVDPYPVEPIYSAPLSYRAPAAYYPPGSWYYCRSSAMYYPYTKACPEGWQAVAARPY